MALCKFWLGKIFKKYVIIWFSRAPTWKRDRILLYNLEYIFLLIIFKKTCAHFWLMESLRKRHLFFDANNFMKNAHTFSKNISLRTCVPNFKVQGHFLQNDITKS